MSRSKHWLTPDWSAPEGVRAATTLRAGGVSLPPYDSLNPALHVGDDVGRVKQNRQIIKNMLELPAEPVWMEQIHSNRVIQADNFTALEQADASYTSERGVVCTIMTADCLPVLVCSVGGDCVGAIHAGWRGLLNGIISNTLAAMGAGDYLVWLGPAIGPECFEVGVEVRDAFVQKAGAFDDAFTQQNNGKWLADIYQLARIELASLGVNKVFGGDFCTMTDAQRFYSYRRDQQTGRMATLIWRE